MPITADIKKITPEKLAEIEDTLRQTREVRQKRRAAKREDMPVLKSFAEIDVDAVYDRFNARR